MSLYTFEIIVTTPASFLFPENDVKMWKAFVAAGMEAVNSASVP